MKHLPDLPPVPQQGDSSYGSSGTQVFTLQGEGQNLGSVLKISMGITPFSSDLFLSAYNHTRITAASKIALLTPLTPCPFPAKLLREMCVVSPLPHLHSLCHSSPSPPGHSTTVPLRELSALPDWLALSSSYQAHRTSAPVNGPALRSSSLAFQNTPF